MNPNVLIDLYFQHYPKIISNYSIQERTTVEKSLSKYFCEKYTGRCLDLKVVTILIKSLKDYQIEYIKEELGEDYLHNPKNVPRCSRNLYLIFFRLKQKLQNLTTKNIYDMNPDDLIDLYLRFYPQDLSKFFHNKTCTRFLNIDLLKFIIANRSEALQDNFRTAFGQNFFEFPVRSNDKYAYKSALVNIYRVKKSLEQLTNDIYDTDVTTMIELYCQNYKVKVIDTDLLIKHNLLYAYTFLIGQKKLFCKIVQDYSYNLGIITYLCTGKYLSRKLNCEEICQILNISLDEVYQNIHIVHSILKALNEEQSKNKVYKKF